MIKDLPDQWYVWVPTQDIKDIIVEKLESFGHQKLYYDGIRSFPCLIASMRENRLHFSDFNSLNNFSDLGSKEEITIRAILQGEAEEVKEKSLDEKMDECFLHLSTRCATDLKSYLKAFAKLILDECKK